MQNIFLEIVEIFLQASDNKITRYLQAMETVSNHLLRVGLCNRLTFIVPAIHLHFISVVIAILANFYFIAKYKMASVHRYQQTTLLHCLQVSLIGLSDADIAIFGGDLNASPIENPHHPYGMMRSMMRDSLTERYPTASLHPAFATFGNADNSYTHNDIPERIDYLMFRAKSYIDMKVSTVLIYLVCPPACCPRSALYCQCDLVNIFKSTS